MCMHMDVHSHHMVCQFPAMNGCLGRYGLYWLLFAASVWVEGVYRHRQCRGACANIRRRVLE